jgi:hypothetical protein
MHGGLRQSFVALLAAGLVAGSAATALAHPGGLDASGGHHCREAGFASGKCSPLNSYHSHSGGGGSGDGGSSGGGGGASSGTSSGGSGSSGSSSAPSAPAAPADTTPPDRPELGTAAVDGDSVQVPVTGERNSTLRFAVDGDVAHTMTASGEEQTASFRLADGRHTVAVTATDAAGNTSEASDFVVSVDTTAPDAPQLSPAVGDSAGAGTSLQLTGERGADYSIELTGPTADTQSGTLSSDSESFEWLLPNGDYTVSATLTDDNGNESSAASETFTVTLPAPNVPALSVVSDAGADPLEIAVEAPGATTALLTMHGQDGASSEASVELDGDGNGLFEFAGPDGTYGVEVIAVDFQEQRSELARLDDVTIKTSLPGLALSFVDSLLSTGLFAYELQAEEGATVRTLSETEALLAEFTATGLVQEFSFEVPTGEHTVMVSVIDAFGNETVEEFTAAVSSPLGAAGWITLLVVLALIVAIGFGIWKLLQRFRTSPSDSVTQPPPPSGPPLLQQ